MNNLHGIPGLISAFTSAIVAVYATRDLFGGNRLYTFYPSRTPILNSTDYFAYNLTSSKEYSAGGDGRSALQQAGWQLAALALTLFAALVGGKFTGFIMRLPFFDEVDTDSDEIFDDETNWFLPDKRRFSKEFLTKIVMIIRSLMKRRRHAKKRINLEIQRV